MFCPARPTSAFVWHGLRLKRRCKVMNSIGNSKGIILFFANNAKNLYTFLMALPLLWRVTATDSS